MTEPFRVPEPSEAAVDALAGDSKNLLALVGLRAAYAVDMPAIVRAEVEAFFAWWMNPAHFGGINDPRRVRDYFDAYLAARFPEAAPEPTPGLSSEHAEKLGRRLAELGVTDFDKWMESVFAPPSVHGPTPSAPAEPLHLTIDADGILASRAELRMRFTFAEADRLGRLANTPVSPGMRSDAPQAPKGDVTDHTDPVTPNTEWRGCWMHGGNVFIGCDLCKAQEAKRTSCTACPCARCQVEREFVRAWAKVVAYHAHECSWWQNFGGPKHPATVAARRVVEAK